MCIAVKEPLTSDNNEITEKGYVDQRGVIDRRSDLVERLYAGTPDPAIILAV